MSTLSVDALVATLSKSFKLIKASVSRSSKQDQIINLLSNETHLLSALFEINGRPYQVMIDTGATISCIPEYGEIMKHKTSRLEKTNVLVKLANGKEDCIHFKLKAAIRPSGSTSKPQTGQFYILSGKREIMGYQALIGLKHLKLFDLSIYTKDKKIFIYHQGKLIGQETAIPKSMLATLKVIDKVAPYVNDVNIKHILSKYKLVFSDLNAYPINGKPMRFDTVHQRPIFAKQRHYSTEEVCQIKDHINTLLNQGIIEPTDSGYAATSRIIPKKNGSGRLVINYIPLNAVTYRNSYALPHVSDILGALQGKQYFTTMDCAQGFYQISVDPRDRHKTAFSTPVGNYQFTRCPFGARNSCAVFQSEMNRIFFDGLYSKCVIYVDDILIFGETKEEHDENLEWVVNRCAQNNVKIKLEKCSFAQREVKYLGFQVSGDSIKPITSKIDWLMKSEAPKDKTELRSIIGKLNFYSRFITNYSKLLEPLRSLLTKNKDYQWKPFHQEAFNALISQLNNSDCHVLVPRKLPKILSLHIMQDSVESILHTEDNKLVNRCSRLLSAAEANYSSVEKQLLGLVFAINKFKLLLEPERFTIRLADKGLEKAINLVNRPERVEQWLLKLPVGFDTFKFEIDTSIPKELHKKNSIHIPEEIFYIDGACKANGKPNCRASWAVCAEYDRELELSGMVIDNPSNQSAELTAAIKACEEAKRLRYKEITIVTDSKYLFNAATQWIDKWRNNDWKDNKKKPVVHTDLFKALLFAKQDLEIQWIHVKGHGDDLGNIRADLLAKSLLDKKAETLNAIVTSHNSLQQNNGEIVQLKDDIRQGLVKDLKIINDTVYFIDNKFPEGHQERIYVPVESRHWLVTLAHDDVMYGGHLGIKKTFRKLLRFWWPKMHHEVESYVKSCDICQKFKNPSGLPPGYLHSIPVSQVFEHVHIDIVGPIQTTYTGNCYIITATDAFSKWAVAVPVQTIRTSNLIKFLEDHILAIHGIPKVIITDRGTQFTSEEWSKYIKKMNINHKLTTAYHPQTNGIDERLNGTLIRILRAYVNYYQRDWDQHLKWSLYVYNTTVHESTGYSPYQILHGLDPRSPLKPESYRENSILTDANKSKQDIRSDVYERIKVSQENMKKYYDRTRSKPNFYIGQLIYVKIHAPPTYLSKKLYIKWDGPFIITSFVGDSADPRAVCILDFKNLIKRTVAICDIKPVVDLYKNPEDPCIQNQKGGGHTLDDSSDSQDLFDPSYHVDVQPSYSENLQANINESNANISPDIAHQSPNSEISNRNSQTPSEIDLTRRPRHGIISSSPRRVTINDNIEMRGYDPQDTPLDFSNSSRDNGRVQTNNQSPQKDQSSVYDYPNNTIGDPTYKPPSCDARRTSGIPRAIRIENSPELSTSSQDTRSHIPRYNLRSGPKGNVANVTTRQQISNANVAPTSNRLTNNDHTRSTASSDAESSSNIENQQDHMQDNTEIVGLCNFNEEEYYDCEEPNLIEF